MPFASFNSSGKYTIGLIQAVEVLFETNLEPKEYGEIDDSSKMGNKLLFLLREGQGQRITRVGIRPNLRFVKEIRGKGQGYTNLANTAIPELRPRLGEAGTKWFDYISQNRLDRGSIKLATVINRFGWKEKQAEQGLPRCLELAIKGFNECISEDHIYKQQATNGKLVGSYYDEKRTMFVWQRTRRWVSKNVKIIEPKASDYYVKRLKSLIKKNNWTVTTVAEKIGVSRGHLSRVLSNKEKVGEDMTAKIRTVTG